MNKTPPTDKLPVPRRPPTCPEYSLVCPDGGGAEFSCAGVGGRGGRRAILCSRVEVSYLPAAHTQKEAQHIGLLLLLELFDVFEGTHLEVVLADD
jgi:hypothetical protein